MRATLATRAATAAAASAAATHSGPGSVPDRTLHETVSSTLRSPSYLRHAPPRLYVTCQHDHGIAPDACGRHMTRVIDVSREVSPDTPPHTHSVYLLTSTSMADVQFSDTAAQSQVLVGLPHLHHADAVQRFCEAHVPALANVHHIVLPGDVVPTQSLLLKTLLQHLPQARLVCNSFGHALFTNPAFHDGVRRAMLENTPTMPLDLLRFAELPVDRVSSVTDGDAVAVDVPSATATEGSATAIPGSAAVPPSSVSTSPARTLRVVAVQSDGHEQRRKAHSQSHHPAYFTNQPLFFYDSVFHALFVGHTLHRLPWLPSVLKEASRELLLPMPPSLALQHPMSRPNVLLDTWRVPEACADVVKALRRTPELERVLCSSYGELSGNLEDCIAGLESSSDALEQLRSRLARRLATDTSRDVHRWSTALLKRVVQEVVCVHSASVPTTPHTQEQFLGWASREGEWGRLSACLTHAAMVLPPTTEADEAGSAAPSTASTPTAAAEATKVGDDAAHPLEGAAGVDLLVAVFEKKGLQGLCRTVRRETIDVQVFLAMSENDFKTVFKATFGITKRLALLQEELRKNV